MEYVIIGILVIVLIFVRVQVYLVSSSLRLQQYLFDTSWKKVEDCVKQGFSKRSVLGLLDLYYTKGILEVKLNDHVYTCNDSKMFIITMVTMKTLDRGNIKNGEVVTLVFKEEDIPYDFFEANMFSHRTAHMFEFRLKKGPGQRRFRKSRTSFRLPSFGHMKPVAQF